MTTLRERPYVRFNFLVDLSDGVTEGPQAGFQELSGIGMEVTVAEYRNGNYKEDGVMKITGMNKFTTVTMKRGVIGSLNLYYWLDQICLWIWLSDPQTGARKLVPPGGHTLGVYARTDFDTACSRRPPMRSCAACSSWRPTSPTPGMTFGTRAT